MKFDAIMMNPLDNVVTCLRDVTAGEPISFLRGDQQTSVVAAEDIPYCHKAAIMPIEQNEAVIKYGESIGVADCTLKAGQWVNHHNIHSIQRDYASELK